MDRHGCRLCLSNSRKRILHRDCDDAIFVLQSNQFTCLLMVCNILWLYRLEINRFSCVYRYCGILVKHSYTKKKYCVHRNFRGWISFLWLSLNFSCKITEARIFHYLFTNGLIVFLSISIWITAYRIIGYNFKSHWRCFFLFCVRNVKIYTIIYAFTHISKFWNVFSLLFIKINVLNTCVFYSLIYDISE